MINERFPLLVSAPWALQHAGAPDLRIIDASWRLPGGGDARLDYLKRHIPGAVFFPIDEIADRSSDLPHMLPAPADFEQAMGSHGIRETDRVVVYDDQGLFSAARVWWTLKSMGHGEVAVLDGGLEAWIAAGGATTDIVPAHPPQTYRARFDRGRVATHDDVRAALADGTAIVLDARPAGRFSGKDQEPRPGLRPGAMPGASNVPASSLIGADGRLKPPLELKRTLEAAGALSGVSVITTCGSGVTAAILSLALEALGRSPSRLYDGSWAEWGRLANNPEAFPVVGGAR
jgi:thiosulfate/3-mercaptopyruvate sulfurtransferase